MVCYDSPQEWQGVDEIIYKSPPALWRELLLIAWIAIKWTAFVKDRGKQKEQIKYLLMKRTQWYNTEEGSIEWSVPATHMLVEE